MNFAEIIKLLANSNLTFGGAALGIAWILRPVLLGLVTAWNNSLERRTKSEEARATHEQRQTDVLSKLEKTTEASSVVITSVLNLLQPISQIPANIDAIGKQMTQRSDAREDLYRGQGHRIEAIHQLVSSLPDAYLAKTAAHFDPTLSNIQASINLLRTQIESRQDAMTPDVAKEIRGELAKIYRLVSAINEKNGTGESPGPSTKEQG